MGLPIGLPERSRRAFWARLYARRRLLSRLAAPFAPLHYALIGESLGYRPNAFFDPSYFRAHANIAQRREPRLARAYLARPEPSAPSPSAEFDHRWYVSQNPDWAQSHPHPFLHFLEHGLRAGRRPRPDIDVEFVRDITRGVKAALARGGGLPSLRPHARAKARWGRRSIGRNCGRVRTVSMPMGDCASNAKRAHPERNVLVFVQCGKGFDAAYLEEPRAYDVLLNYYHEASVHPKADIAVLQAGTKTTSIRRLMELRPDLLLRYQAVLFLDDDVEIDADGHRSSFPRDGGGKTRSCAASAHRGFGHRLSVPEKTVRRPRRDAGVVGRDHGAGADAPRARKREMGIRGIGQRLGQRPLLGPAVRSAFGPNSVGVIGSVAVRHAAPVDLRAGAFYAFLRRYGVDPGHEANRIAVDFGVERFLRRLAPGEDGRNLPGPR